MNNHDKPATQTETPDFYTEQCFRLIDGPVLEMWEGFPISLLRLGRILTAKEAERRDFTAAKISKLLRKHRNIMLVSYGPMAVRDASTPTHI